MVTTSVTSFIGECPNDASPFFSLSQTNRTLYSDAITGKEQWYKFDDGEVTECKMHEDDEMKAQCFGGDYMGEVYDNNLKRMQLRRQKRWWNAYMLFYTRCDEVKVPVITSIEQLSLAESRNCVLPMPAPIEKSVRSQNLRFLHSRNLFSAEFFNFIRKLVSCCLPSNLNGVEKWVSETPSCEWHPKTNNFLIRLQSPQAEELSLLGIQLGSQFLFHSGFHTKKTLRGPAIDWYEVLKIPMHYWYAFFAFFSFSCRFVHRRYVHDGNRTSSL